MGSSIKVSMFQDKRDSRSDWSGQYDLNNKVFIILPPPPPGVSKCQQLEDPPPPQHAEVILELSLIWLNGLIRLNKLNGLIWLIELNGLIGLVG